MPAPFGLDISADGSTIYVGTFTDFIYTIDLQQLVVTGQISFAEPLLSTQSAVVNSPSAVATLSNGNVMVLLGAGDGTGAGGSLVIWDPVTDQIVETIPTQYPAIGPMARSGDHTKVAFTYQLEGGKCCFLVVRLRLQSGAAGCGHEYYRRRSAANQFQQHI